MRVDVDNLRRRTKQFAHACVKLAAELPMTTLGNVIRGQLIRCATSTAANYRATCLAQSKATFVAKISIVYEEADEAWFWLEFALEEGLLNEGMALPVTREAEELTAIFSASRKTATRGRD